ncbi:hypothetical protein HL658_10825 [Azospirillum sp. RWY-5-1]|uniref:Polysaccharide deacetylase n=2 Tax=Azospirillum oleiclasticum TaxID=2735135 RepID=A0ABX2T7H1_9PROT|nr:hypothetical protein [Azospirillum oleiclasticum]NYZ20279.1 hypothetical protein [Azospirillum oleiclasticum]
MTETRIDGDRAPDGWDALAAELDLWAAAGRPATLWWRDDDATAPGAALDRLLELGARHDVPVALAVIPARAQPALADALRGAAVLQHGWSHANHAPLGAKKCELGDDRPVEAVTAELAEGWRRLSALVGPALLPVLVPPWNRIAPAVSAALPGLGFRALSTDREHDAAVPGLAQVNTHLDPVDWRHGGGFLGTAAALAGAIDHLRARRLGTVPDRPTGLLTHHLAMDGATWDFVDRLLAVTAGHSAARWLAAPAVFAHRGGVPR